MNPRLAKMLVRLYPRAWKERYGEEFFALLESHRAGAHAAANVAWAALQEHFVMPRGSEMNPDRHFPATLALRAPWAVFAVAPLLLLAVAYCVASWILLTGWRMFLPQAQTPFVPVYGACIFYFGVGRLLYLTAPVLVGWSTVALATKLRYKLPWPVCGTVLIAIIGGMAQIIPARSISNGIARTQVHFALKQTGWGTYFGLSHMAIILAFTLVPYLFLWRAQRSRLNAIQSANALPRDRD